MKELTQLTVEICIGTSCHLLGAEDLLDAIKRLPVKIQDKIAVQSATCLQHCGKGPNVRINGLVLTDVTPDYLLQIINENFKEMPEGGV